jgi:hypothetical protein
MKRYIVNRIQRAVQLAEAYSSERSEGSEDVQAALAQFASA